MSNVSKRSRNSKMNKEALKAKFDRLAAEWRQETRFESAASRRAIHWSYQQIIGMGQPVVPILLDELRQNKDNPEYWFWALAAITGANPVPDEDRGKFSKMSRHWLRWASKQEKRIPNMPNLRKINIIDVESTCWEDVKPPEGQVSEIIEIGIVVLDRETWTIEDKRSIMVKPVQSEVSDFCTELTTITPEMVEEGMSLDGACDILKYEYDSQKRLWGSWGDYDRRMFEIESGRKDVVYPFGNSHLNVKIMFGLLQQYYKAPGMQKALERLDFEAMGTHHRGHDDAHNIARILRELLQ